MKNPVCAVFITTHKKYVQLEPKERVRTEVGAGAFEEIRTIAEGAGVEVLTGVGVSGVGHT